MQLVLTLFRVLITPLTSTPEPPSKPSRQSLHAKAGLRPSRWAPAEALQRAGEGFRGFIRFECTRYSSSRVAGAWFSSTFCVVFCSEL